MISLKEICLAWNKFWFEPTSPSPICVYRIFYGLILTAYGILWIPDALVWFGHAGPISAEAAQQWAKGPRLSLLLWLKPDDTMVLLLLYLLILASICVAIGLWTRYSTLIAWILLESFCHRDPFIMNVGDSLLRTAGFLLIFAPAGAMYSVDNWLANRSAPTNKKLYSPWAQRLLQVQLAAIYAQGFWSKIRGESWWDGTASYYAIHIAQYSHFPIPDFLNTLATYRLISWGTIAIELSLWTLIWIREFRYCVLLAGILMHIGIDLFMNLPMLACAFTAVYVNFVDPCHLEHAIACLRSRFAVARSQVPDLIATDTSLTRYRPVISLFIALYIYSIWLAAYPEKTLWQRSMIKPVKPVIRFLGLIQNYSVFAPDVERRSTRLDAVVTYSDGRSSVWHYPQAEKYAGFDRIVKVRYRRFLCWPKANLKIVWPGLARYVARLSDTPEKHPISVDLVRYATPTPPPYGLPGKQPQQEFRSVIFNYTVKSDDLL